MAPDFQEPAYFYSLSKSNCFTKTDPGFPMVVAVRFREYPIANKYRNFPDRFRFVYPNIISGTGYQVPHF